MSALAARESETAVVLEPRFDVMLVGALAALLAYGWVMVYSATIATADAGLTPNFRHIGQHSIHIAAGIVLAALTAWTRVGWWERCSRIALVLALIGLAALMLPGAGINVNGSTRWLAVGAIRIQPAEFAKVLLVVYAAGYLTRKREALGEFGEGVVKISLVLATAGLLLLWQPDLGSFVVMTASVGLMLFLAGIRLWHFLLCTFLGIAAVALLTVIEPYRMERVMSFLNPWSDPYDSGFQLVQALIAFGRGEWSGVGLGASIQKLYYLPHASNDFLLAVIGEELGFVGVCTVMVLFGVLLWRAMAIARRAESVGMRFGARLAEGLGLLLTIQAMINMGVNLGALPTKGLTLPFMSYGGSSMLASCLAAGLLLAVDRAARLDRRGRSA